MYCDAGVPMKTLRLIAILLCVSLPLCGIADPWTPFQISVMNPAQIFPENRDIHGLRVSILHGCNGDLNGIDAGPISINICEGRLIGIQAGGLLNSAEKGAIGLQVGIGVNLSENTVGMQVAGVGTKSSTISGAQIAGVFNNSETCRGLQAGLANRSVNLDGLQMGFIGIVEHDMNGLQVTASPLLSSGDSGCAIGGTLRGWQIGSVSSAANAFGVQVGCLVTYSDNCKGLQIGTVNLADRMTGVQIGVVNYCYSMRGIQIGLVNVISDSSVPFLPVINASF